jgi:hexosaminidase
MIIDRLLPQVKKIELLDGFINLRPKISLIANTPSIDVAQRISQTYNAIFNEPTLSENAPSTNPVCLIVDDQLGIDAEAYFLEINLSGINITASRPMGLYYGVQTLLQFLPVEVYANRWSEESWRLPCMRIQDEPRFIWRGAMLDVSRHFMPKEFIFKFLDLLAMHKHNSFHWHLTDDQGWRIEIRKYPKLTEVGSRRACTLIGHNSERPRGYDATPYKGFYTQDEIREVVKYAADRYTAIIPEIDMPGHMQAAIAAYPQLGNLNAQLEPLCHWGISPHILNPQQSTIRFMQDVLDEVIELFPGEYIHVGGDEAVKTEWAESRVAQQRMYDLGLHSEAELQSWFIQQMDIHLAAYGRKLIGWDEILEGGLPQRVTVMSWRGFEGAVEAARLGHDAVVAPESHVYFDHYQTNDRDNEPLAIGGYTSLEKVYNFEPIPERLASELAYHIMGSQCQLWTEYIPTSDHVEYMAFPRLCALAEVLWSPRDQRDDFERFKTRLKLHLQRLDMRHVKYHQLDT